MTVALCKVLGRGDLGGLTLGDLEQASDAELADLLASRPGGEAHQSEALPLPALVLLAGGLGGGGEEVPLILIATRQDPPHPDDTVPVAQLYERALRHRPDLFGVRLRPETVTISQFSFDATARAVAAAVQGVGATQVFVGVGGSVVLLTGAVVGALQGGARASVVPVNRQDRDAPLAPVGASADLVRWLGRTRRYGVLARVGPEEFRSAFAAAGHLVRTQWSEAWKHDHRQLPAVDPEQLPKVNRSRSVHLLNQLRACYALALRAALVADEPFAANLVRPWLSWRFEAQVSRDPQAVRLLGQLRAEAIRTALPKDHKKIERTESLALLRRCDPEHTLRDRLRPELQELASDAVFDLWGMAAEADHELRTLHPRIRSLLGEVGLEQEPDAAKHLHQRAGIPLGRPLSPTGRLLMMCVGRSNRPADDPFLQAVQGGLRRDDQLVLACSAETLPVAQHLAEVARRDRVSAEVVTLDDPWELTRTRDQITTALVGTSERLGDLQQLDVIVGPGTAAMNLGLLLAAVATAFEHHAGLRIGAAHPQGDRTEIRWTETGHDLALFVDQSLIGEAVTVALDHWDLALAEDICALAGRDWAGARARCTAVRNDFFRTDDQTEQGLADRLGLLSELAGADPHLALYLAAAVVTTYQDQTRKKIAGARELQGDRTHSPLGHDPAKERTPRKVRQAITDCVPRKKLEASRFVQDRNDLYAMVREIAGGTTA